MLDLSTRGHGTHNRRGWQICLWPLAFDAVASGMAVIAAYTLQSSVMLSDAILLPELAMAAVLVAAVSAVMSFLFGLARGIWRFTSIPDVLAVLQSALVSFALCIGLVALLGLLAISTSTLLIAFCLTVSAMVGARTGFRMWCQSQSLTWLRGAGQIDRIPVVVVNADSNADLFIKAAHDRVDAHYEVVAIFDARDRRTGLDIRRVPVISSLQQLSRLADRLSDAGRPLQHLIITRDRRDLDSAQLERLVEWAAERRCSMRRSIDLAVSTETGPQDLATVPLRIEDLLERPVTTFLPEGVEASLSDRCVLVTGAGGSIGSELCRRIAAFRPKKMVLIDCCEFNLSVVMRSLADWDGARSIEIVPLFGDVRDRSQMFAMFDVHRPDLVFHAAALKHVPIVEWQPLAGVVTNVLGTRNVADASRTFSARAMVMISTDKAVNPTSLMGATKRLAELYCQARDLSADTRFVTVRFGNVLGSSGSVVPLFEQQIQTGGPVTVTHPDMTRYFMTIPEAAQLVLHAMDAALVADDQRGHVHVLDMGEPIRIMDLARKMIMLSGLQPGIDIEVRMTGLRPGEKLYEELFTVDEEQISTSYKSVLIGAPLNPRDLQDVFSQVDRLATAIEKRDLETAHAIIRETVPEARLGVLGQTDPAADARRQGSQQSTRQPAPAAVGNVVPLTLATARDR